MSLASAPLTATAPASAPAGFEDPAATPADHLDAARRADLARLERLLHPVLLEQGGTQLVSTLAALRRAPTGGHVAGLVSGLDDGLLLPVIRACSLHLGLANLAQDADHRRRSRDAEPPWVSSGPAPTLPSTPPLDVRLVLTAHPTDMARRSVLSKRRTVTRCLERLDDPRLGPSERRSLEDEISEELSIWYATEEVRSLRPRVA